MSGLLAGPGHIWRPVTDLSSTQSKGHVSVFLPLRHLLLGTVPGTQEALGNRSPCNPCPGPPGCPLPPYGVAGQCLHAYGLGLSLKSPERKKKQATEAQREGQGHASLNPRS